MSPVIEVVNIAREVSWLPWAVQYFFLIGLSVGGFALSLPGLAFGNAAWLRVARLALLVALVTGLAAPVALLADLHQPGRFWRFYAQPNLRSWMAWGAFFIPGYLGGLLLYAFAALRPALPRPLRGPACPLLLRGASLLGVVFGALVLLYTGMEVMVVRARPLWNTPLLPMQFALTAFAGAVGGVLLLDRLLGGHDRALAQRLTRLLAWLMFAALVLGGIWLAFGALRREPVHAAALASVVHSPAWRATALWAGGAALLTATLAALPRLGWLAGLLALHSAWMFRWTVFIGGQTVPKTGAGFYDYHLPLGHDGWLGILGTAGLCLFLLIALTSLLPWDKATGRAEA